MFGELQKTVLGFSILIFLVVADKLVLMQKKVLQFTECVSGKVFELDACAGIESEAVKRTVNNF